MADGILWLTSATSQKQRLMSQSTGYEHLGWPGVRKAGYLSYTRRGKEHQPLRQHPLPVDARTYGQESNIRAATLQANIWYIYLGHT